MTAVTASRTVLCSADHHWNVNVRWLECLRIHQWIVELAARLQPALYICAGDIYERASLPQERQLVAMWLVALAQHCPVLVIRGNHDQSLDCEIMGRLKSRHPIVVEEAAGVHLFGDIAVAAMAWPMRENLLAQARSTGMPVETTAQDALRAVLGGLGAQLAEHHGPKIAAGHWMARGAITSLGQPLVGVPMSVGLEELSLLRADLVLMGHVHKPQHWTHEGVDYLYTGSPYRTTWGELEDKSVVVVTVDEARVCGWRRETTPCTAMHLVHEVFADGTFGAGPEAWIAEDLIAGAEIRLRYEVGMNDRAAARVLGLEWAKLWSSLGAASVKLEEVVRASQHARVPEVAAAQTLPDKLLALWLARGSTPDNDTTERLFGKLSELEQEP